MCDGPVSQFWEAGQLRECDPSLLCPMYAQGLRHFYVDELAELETGELVIPQMWITVSGIVHAVCLHVIRMDDVSLSRHIRKRTHT
jgi:hypothetical protein